MGDEDEDEDGDFREERALGLGREDLAEDEDETGTNRPRCT